MKSHALALLVIAAVVSVGCNQRRSGGGPITIIGDAGRDARGGSGDPDGGDDVDAGIVINLDMGGRDMGTIGFDAGRDMGTVGFDAGRDMGTVVPECPPDVLTPVDSAAYCGSSTSTCASACPDNACFFDCIDADPNPDCSSCVSYVSYRCYNSLGCQDTWDALSCCANTNCPEGSPDGCVTTACSTEQAAYSTCVDGIADISPCGAFLDPCFGF